MQKHYVFSLIISIGLMACSENIKKDPEVPATTAIEGTWKLLTATVIEKGDTTITDYTKDRTFIKIINDSHFAFLQHGTDKAKDSSFSAGGGSYLLKGNSYTEHLEYCSAREWEGHDFTFTVTITGDTLVQSGVEKIETEGIDRLNTEKYIRVKN